MATKKRKPDIAIIYKDEWANAQLRIEKLEAELRSLRSQVQYKPQPLTEDSRENDI
jgi:PHD/YefM family antitoxin component YafN of YafNO toxin-antitoxin module